MNNLKESRLSSVVKYFLLCVTLLVVGCAPKVVETIKDDNGNLIATVVEKDGRYYIINEETNEKTEVSYVYPKLDD